MFGISLPELLLIFVLILVVLGPEKLPEVARWVGKGLREVRKASNLMRDALMLDEDDDTYNKRRALPKKQTTPKIVDTEAGQPEKVAAGSTPPLPKPAPRAAALDQAGDDFDRALDRHFNAPYSELIEVPLHPGLTAEGLVFVDLTSARATDTRFAIPFRIQAEELVS
ncbi:MAG: twin-arginine translocase TatA/TatE family subunit [Bradymonadaceae bacterium]